MALPCAGEVISLSRLLPRCTWRPLRFGNNWALSTEGWACSQMTTCIATTVMTRRLGQDLELQSSTVGFLLADLTLCLPVFSLFGGWDRATPLSTREALQWICHPTRAEYAECWWFLRIIQTYTQRQRAGFQCQD